MVDVYDRDAVVEPVILIIGVAVICVVYVILPLRVPLPDVVLVREVDMERVLVAVYMAVLVIKGVTDRLGEAVVDADNFADLVALGLFVLAGVLEAEPVLLEVALDDALTFPEPDGDDDWELEAVFVPVDVITALGTGPLLAVGLPVLVLLERALQVPQGDADVLRVAVAVRVAVAQEVADAVLSMVVVSVTESFGVFVFRMVRVIVTDAVDVFEFVVVDVSVREMGGVAVPFELLEPVLEAMLERDDDGDAVGLRVWGMDRVIVLLALVVRDGCCEPVSVGVLAGVRVPFTDRDIDELPEDVLEGAEERLRVALEEDVFDPVTLLDLLGEALDVFDVVGEPVVVLLANSVSVCMADPVAVFVAVVDMVTTDAVLVRVADDDRVVWYVDWALVEACRLVSVGGCVAKALCDIFMVFVAVLECVDELVVRISNPIKTRPG